MKYTLTSAKKDHFLLELYQIKALKNFTRSDGVKVKVGDLGGFVQSETNLSQDGTCWIDDTSIVRGTAKVGEGALILNSSLIKDNAVILGNVTVKNSTISDEAMILDGCQISNSHIYDSPNITGRVQIANSTIYGEAKISGEVRIGDSKISDEAIIKDKAIIENHCIIGGDCLINGNAHIKNHLSIHEFDKIHIDKNVLDFGRFLGYDENNKLVPIALNKEKLQFYYDSQKAAKYLKSLNLEAKFNITKNKFDYKFELLLILPNKKTIKIDKQSVADLAKLG